MELINLRDAQIQSYKDLLYSIKEAMPKSLAADMISQYEQSDQPKLPEKTTEINAQLEAYEDQIQASNQLVQALKEKLKYADELIAFSEQDHASMQKVTQEQANTLNAMEIRYNNIVHEFKEYRDILQKKRPVRIAAQTIKLCMDSIDRNNHFLEWKELEEAYIYRVGFDESNLKLISVEAKYK
jgi:small-conductance mechanosensitive channel